MWFALEILISPIFLSMLKVLLFTQTKSNNSDLIEDTDYGKITELEYHGLKLFREVVEEELEKEYERSDDFLIRWLRDCDMNVNSAAAMLRKNLAWRKENDVDSILDKTFLPVKNRICYLSGFDNRGGPVLIFKVTHIDLRKLITSGLTKQLLHHSDQCFEHYLQASIGGGPNWNETRMTAGITIIDIKGYSIKQQGCINCIHLYRQMSAHSQSYYPQCSRLVVLINLPSFGRPLFEICKSFTSPNIQKTFQVFGSDKDEWTKFLLSVIPAEQLLLEYGGTKLRIAHQH